jgi:hypothetical protein
LSSRALHYQRTEQAHAEGDAKAYIVFAIVSGDLDPVAFVRASLTSTGIGRRQPEAKSQTEENNI